MKSFNYVHSLLSATFINKKAPAHINNQIDNKSHLKTEESDYVYHQKLVKSKPHHTKTRSLNHFKSLPSLQTIFKKQKRSQLTRTRSQMSTCSTDTKMSTQSSFSLKFVASNDSMASTDTLISPKAHTSPFSSDANMSKKSMEFEAMIEEYPSRILKASLTPSLCN